MSMIPCESYMKIKKLQIHITVSPNHSIQVIHIFK